MSRLAAVASTNLALAFSLGAFGAHSLRDKISPDMLAVFKTGQEYHMVVGVVVLLLTLTGSARPTFRKVAMALLAGTALFSGSLYLLAVTGTRAWGMVTPLGGVVWIGAMLTLSVSLWNSPMGPEEPSEG